MDLLLGGGIYPGTSWHGRGGLVEGTPFHSLFVPCRSERILFCGWEQDISRMIECSVGGLVNAECTQPEDNGNKHLLTSTDLHLP